MWGKINEKNIFVNRMRVKLLNNKKKEEILKKFIE